MSELPYMPIHIDDSIADSDELTNEELGAYFRLQRALWRAGGYLPVENLPFVARAGRRWGKIKAKIIKKLTVIEGTVSCRVILEQLGITRARRASAKARASAGGKAASRSRAPFRVATSGNRSAEKPLRFNETITLQELAQANSKHANQKSYKESKSLPIRDDEGGEVYAIGIKMLVERVKLRNLAARSQVAKWLTAVGNEGDLLALFDAAITENLTQSRLVAVIDQRVRTLKVARERGETLPFGFQPNVVSKSS